MLFWIIDFYKKNNERELKIIKNPFKKPLNGTRKPKVVFNFSYKPLDLKINIQIPDHASSKKEVGPL